MQILITTGLTGMKLLYTSRLFAFMLLFLASMQVSAEEEDHRAWQHGIELLRLNGKNLLLWSSWGNPPAANPGADWEHDIYYSWIDSCANSAKPSLLMGGPEAQEPPSAAVNNRGKVLLTWEDGSDGINQYAAFWDASTHKTGNRFLIRSGGHSGHVAASRDRFLVAYSEDWVDADDGFLKRGTGKNLFARIVKHDGHAGPELRISPGQPEKREDWPLVAGSESGWMIVWQRYPERTLHAAVIDRSGAILRKTLIAKDLRVGYHYDVQYLPALNSYFVLATTVAGGTAVLLNVQGQIIARHDSLPPLVSESRFIWTHESSGVIGVYPVMPSGVAVIHVSAEKITLQKIIASDFQWDYIGTTGTFVSPSRVLFATLSTKGLKVFTFKLSEPSFMPGSKLCATAGNARP